MKISVISIISITSMELSVIFGQKHLKLTHFWWYTTKFGRVHAGMPSHKCVGPTFHECFSKKILINDILLIINMYTCTYNVTSLIFIQNVLIYQYCK